MDLYAKISKPVILKTKFIWESDFIWQMYYKPTQTKILKTLLIVTECKPERLKRYY